MATSTGDRTLNKVAFCSAVVAGAAYVSYKYFVNKKVNRSNNTGIVVVFLQKLTNLHFVLLFYFSLFSVSIFLAFFLLLPSFERQISSY